MKQAAGKEPQAAMDRFPDLIRYRTFDPGQSNPVEVQPVDGSRSVTAVIRYEVTLATRGGLRVLTAQAEREVALMAESVLRRCEGETLGIGITVACTDGGARRRIASYLKDLILELGEDWSGDALHPSLGIAPFL